MRDLPEVADISAGLKFGETLDGKNAFVIIRKGQSTNFTLAGSAYIVLRPGPCAE